MIRFERPLRLRLYPLAALAVLASCDAPQAAHVVQCRDTAWTLAVSKARAQVYRLEVEERRARIGGAPYVAAKVGPIPGRELGVASESTGETIAAARRNLAAIEGRCGATPDMAP